MLGLMSTIPHFNVEDQLATAFASVGGVRVSDLLGRAPGHDNADFFFDAANVVAELKCLDEDKIHDDRIIEKASSLYLEELRAGRTKDVVIGESYMTTGGHSADFTAKIAALYRVPIERQVRKAEKQIFETKRALRRTDAVGLLLLANNNHTALDPWHAWYLINKIMKKSEYPNINAAVLFAGNLGASLPGHEGRVDYWIEFPRPAGSPVGSAILTAGREAWYRHLGKIFGTSVATMATVDLETLARLESR